MARILIDNEDLAIIVKECFEKAKNRFDKEYDKLLEMKDCENKALRNLYLLNHVATGYFGNELKVNVMLRTTLKKPISISWIREL